MSVRDLVSFDFQPRVHKKENASKVKCIGHVLNSDIGFTSLTEICLELKNVPLSFETIRWKIKVTEISDKLKFGNMPLCTTLAKPALQSSIKKTLRGLKGS